MTTTLLNVAGVFLGPVLGRQIAKSSSARGVLTVGTIVRILITVAFIFLLKPTTSIMLIYVLMLLGGLYNSQQTVTFSAGPQIQIKPEIRILGNSVVQVAQNIGSVVAMVFYTIIIAGYGVVDGLPVAFWLAVALAAIALVLGLFLKKLEEPKAA
jgi:MFS family permease